MTWLAEVLSEAGLRVLPTTGWQTRGKDDGSYSMRPQIVIGHHTASPATWTDAQVNNLLIVGRPDLPGPLCHLGLNRLGEYILIAAGKANHAGVGYWFEANESVEAIGIEAYNYGNGVPFPSREAWPQVQMEAYDRGIAALLKKLGKSSIAYCGHREWATPGGRKADPSGIDLVAQRKRVQTIIDQKETTVILRMGGPQGPYINLFKKALNTVNALNTMGHAPLDGNGIFDKAMKDLVQAYQTGAGIGGVVPELGALDDLTRDLLIEYTRDGV